MTDRLSLKARATAVDLSGREALGAAIAVSGEAVVVLLSFSRDVPAGTFLVVHILVIAVMAYALLVPRHEAADPSMAYTMLLVTAVSGPAGALATLCALPFVGHAGAGPDVLDAWYDRLSAAGGVLPETAMHDRIAAGRVLNWESPAPHNFLDVIENGSLTDRQEALGLMARTFHTDFAPALQAALRSPEPVVRVQAAAVVARVRADLKLRIKSLLSAERSRPVAASAPRTAAELTRYANCALVDRAEQERCRFAASRILLTSLVSNEDVFKAARAANGETAGVIESFLMDARRFKEFRVARRIHDLVTSGSYRVRKMRREAMT